MTYVHSPYLKTIDAGRIPTRPSVMLGGWQLGGERIDWLPSRPRARTFLGPAALPGYFSLVTPVRRHGGIAATLCIAESVAEDGRRSLALGRVTYPNNGHLVLPSRVCKPGFLEIQSAEPPGGIGPPKSSSCDLDNEKKG